VPSCAESVSDPKNCERIQLTRSLSK
jgi:hypothetical protein